MAKWSLPKQEPGRCQAEFVVGFAISLGIAVSEIKLFFLVVNGSK
jgi:hypothetical protein